MRDALGFGQKLKERRLQLGFSLRDVEEITGGAISNAYLCQLEGGKIKNPSIAVCVNLGAAYAVTAETILEWFNHVAVFQPTAICPTCGQALGHEMIASMRKDVEHG